MVESHPTRDMGAMFVGRRREMAQLEATLAEALAGRGRMVMLAGEPGIGKTRTTQELAAQAKQQGAQDWQVHYQTANLQAGLKGSTPRNL